MTLLFWLRVFISPLSLGGIISFFVWFNSSGIIGDSIAVIIAVTGFAGGILLAEKARKEGKNNFSD